jgi:hypothetical protein
MSDPFTQAYNALWAMLESNVAFTNVVKVTDRIKYDTGKKDPEKDSIQNAALPEVRIVDIGGTGGNRKTSNSFSIIRRYQVQISTDYLTLQGNATTPDGLYPVEWAIMCAFGTAGTFSGITSGGQSVPCEFRYSDFVSSLYDSELSRQKGWIGVINCEVEFWFSKRLLVPVPATKTVTAGTAPPSPNCAGIYTLRGMFNGEYYYRRQDDAFYYFFSHVNDETWMVASELAEPTASSSYWSYQPGGSYVGVNGCTGTVSVS